MTTRHKVSLRESVRMERGPVGMGYVVFFLTGVPILAFTLGTGLYEPGRTPALWMLATAGAAFGMAAYASRFRLKLSMLGPVSRRWSGQGCRTVVRTDCWDRHADNLVEQAVIIRHAPWLGHAWSAGLVWIRGADTRVSFRATADGLDVEPAEASEVLRNEHASGIMREVFGRHPKAVIVATGDLVRIWTPVSSDEQGELRWLARAITVIQRVLNAAQVQHRDSTMYRGGSSPARNQRAMTLGIADSDTIEIIRAAEAVEIAVDPDGRTLSGWAVDQYGPGKALYWAIAILVWAGLTLSLSGIVGVVAWLG